MTANLTPAEENEELSEDGTRQERGVPVWAFLAVSAVALALTAALVVPSLTLESFEEEVEDPFDDTGDGVLASVGGNTLTTAEVSAAGLSPEMVDQWVEDELLAQLAVHEGLENEVLSGFVMDRARQLYLRDRIMDQALACVEPPDSSEVFAFMRTDSLSYLVERHYYHMLLSDSTIADSIHARLRLGQNFQTTAQRLSMGQKAGISGDMDFLTGGELMLRGFPSEIARLEGLSDIYLTEMGYHIFLVTETRALTDTERVVSSISEPLYRIRQESTTDSLLEEAQRLFDVRLQSTGGG